MTRNNLVGLHLLIDQYLSILHKFAEANRTFLEIITQLPVVEFMPAVFVMVDFLFSTRHSRISVHGKAHCTDDE